MLYPPYMPPQGLPPCNTNNIRSDYHSPGSNTDSSITRSATSNHNNSNLNRSRNNMATCPCCGNMTTKETIQRGHIFQMLELVTSQYLSVLIIQTHTFVCIICIY